MTKPCDVRIAGPLAAYAVARSGVRLRGCGAEPPVTQIAEVAIEVADQGASPDTRRFEVCEGPASRGEVRGRSCRSARHDPPLAQLVEGQERLGTEVRHDRVGGAAAAEGVTQDPLGRSEEPLQAVGARRDAGVVEAVEQVVLVATGSLDDAVDEGSRRRSEAHPRDGFEGREVSVPPRLGLDGVGGPIGPVWGSRQLVGQATEDLRVALDPAREASVVPGRRQRAVQLVDQGP